MEGKCLSYIQNILRSGRERERLHGMQEVAGSNPAGSTMNRLCAAARVLVRTRVPVVSLLPMRSVTACPDAPRGAARSILRPYLSRALLLVLSVAPARRRTSRRGYSARPVTRPNALESLVAFTPRSPARGQHSVAPVPICAR